MPQRWATVPAETVCVKVNLDAIRHLPRSAPAVWTAWAGPTKGSSSARRTAFTPPGVRFGSTVSAAARRPRPRGTAGPSSPRAPCPRPTCPSKIAAPKAWPRRRIHRRDPRERLGRQDTQRSGIEPTLAGEFRRQKGRKDDGREPKQRTPWDERPASGAGPPRGRRGRRGGAFTPRLPQGRLGGTHSGGR